MGHIGLLGLQLLVARLAFRLARRLLELLLIVRLDLGNLFLGVVHPAFRSLGDPFVELGKGVLQLLGLRFGLVQYTIERFDRRDALLIDGSGDALVQRGLTLGGDTRPECLDVLFRLVGGAAGVEAERLQTTGVTLMRLGLIELVIGVLELLLQRLLTADIQHGIPGFGGNILDTLPGRLDESEVVRYLTGAGNHGGAELLHGQVGRSNGVALLLQGDDLRIHRCRQIVVLLVQLG
ncbi:hypothetical protein D9M71_406290 [compost metagenome]